MYIAPFGSTISCSNRECGPGGINIAIDAEYGFF